jgi:hypothetical protein
VLCDDAQRDVLRVVLAVALPRERLDGLHQRTHEVRLEVRVESVDHGRQPLERGPGIDVLRGQVSDDLPLAVDLVLHEDVVPDLHVPLFVDLGTALRPVLRAPIDEDLRRRAPRTSVDPPEVVFAPAAHDPLSGDADLPPDAERLLVGLEDGGPQQVGIQAQPFGHELEAPGQGLPLEVVPEGEVAEHLEHRQMPGRASHVLDVHGAEALLDRCRAPEQRLGDAQEVRDELVHPGVGQQQARFGRGNERRGLDPRMSPLLEEAQERLANLTALHGCRV